MRCACRANAALFPTGKCIETAECVRRGIVSPQFALLLATAKIGLASRAEIGRFHRQDRSTLTRNAKPMLSAGWIEEVQVGERGRARRIAVTKVGRRLLQEAAPHGDRRKGGPRPSLATVWMSSRIPPTV